VVAFAFDSSGAIRWYREFPGNEPVSGDFKQQPDGNFTLFHGSSYGSQHVPGEYIEFTPSGDSPRSITLSTSRYLDNHELLMTTGPDGKERLHFFQYDHRPVDLTYVGVRATIPVAGRQLVRLRSDGSTEFEWNAWDHIAPTEWIEPPSPERAVEYALDTTAMTATLVWQFRHSPIIYTPYVGLVQRLRNGNTSIAYAQAGHATEVKGADAVLWEADVKVDGQPAFCYRLSRIVSLYRYQAP
jgi:hypothetical protein